MANGESTISCKSNEIKKKFTSYIGNIILLFASILFVAIFIELSLKYFPVYSWAGYKFPERYIVDGIKTHDSGFYQRHNYLPFSMKAGEKLTLVDLAWHPLPFTFTLDRFGYRNSQKILLDKASTLDEILVGDSVAWGYGVDDSETLAEKLKGKYPVYNLSMPGAGPASYMRMISDILKRKTPRRIIVLFYEGNDFYNIRDSWWPELLTCSPPLSGEIRRRDIPHPQDLRSDDELMIVMMLKRLINKLFNTNNIEDYEIADKYTRLYNTAISDYEILKNSSDEISKAKKKTIHLLEKLNASNVMSLSERQSGREIVSQMYNNTSPDITDKSIKLFVMKLIDNNHYPVADYGYLSLSKLNYSGWYKPYEISELKDKHTGNIQVFKEFIVDMSTYKSTKDKLKPLLYKLTNSFSIKSSVNDIKAINDNVLSILNTIKHPAADESCNKIDIFIEYLNDVARRGVEIALVNIPSEYFLKTYKNGTRHFKQICSNDKIDNVRCIDLTGKLIRHYSDKNNNGLFLDGSHLTVDGNVKVANWMREHIEILSH